jgi:hypothetical protein
LRSDNNGRTPQLKQFLAGCSKKSDQLFVPAPSRGREPSCFACQTFSAQKINEYNESTKANIIIKQEIDFTEIR